MAEGGPREVWIPFPVPERVTCPRCWEGGRHLVGKIGSFCDPSHLAKHQKKMHPGDTVNYECSECCFRAPPKSGYPLKVVKQHFREEHSVARADAPPPPPPAPSATRRATSRPPTATTTSAVAPSVPRSTRASTEPPASVTRAGTSGVRTRTTRAAAPPASEADRRLTRGATTRGLPPSTAAPAAAGNITRTTTRATTTARTSTIATKRPPLSLRRKKQPETPSPSAPVVLSSSAAEDTPPSYAAVTRAPATQESTTSSTGTAAGAAEAAMLAGTTPPQRTTPPTGAANGSAPRDAAATGTSAPAGAFSRVGVLRDFYESPPEARPAVVPPDWLAPTSDGANRGRVSPAVTTATAPRTTSTVGAPRALDFARGSPPVPLTTAGSASPPHCTPPSASPTTCEATGGALTSAIISTPVRSAPATLTTTTVVTSAAGSPIMSTGLPGVSGGCFPPPVTRAPSPPMPRSPPVAVTVAGPSKTPRRPTIASRITLSTLHEESPPRRVLRPRPDKGKKRGVARITSSTSSSGDERSGGAGGGPERDDGVQRHAEAEWTVAAGRAARRRARRVGSSLSTEDEASGAESRATASPPPLTAATASRSTGSGGTPPAGSAEVAARPTSAGEFDSVHSSAPRNVRGVMGRRGTPAAVGEHPGRAGATAAPAVRARGGARPPAAPRNPPARDAPAAAPTARQRNAERRRLVAAVESAATLADLERLTTQVVGFFGGRGQGGGAPRPRDRPARSREAGNNARGVERAGDGASAQGGEGPAPAETPMFSGERRVDAGREAARIQALFRGNRRKAIREVLAGPAEVCDLPTRQIQEHFEGLHCGGEDLFGAEPAERPEALSEDEQAAALTRPFAGGEVGRRLRRMNNSAPGPDGLTYRDLRVADPAAQLLVAVFNTCLRLEAVPASWKTSNTVLVYKKGDRGMLENWRPLALGDTIPKLFAAVLADRLTDWAISHRKLSPAQKGFLRDEGCYEHNFVLQEILTDARRRRREVVVAWLDLSNAFGSVPHGAIRRALVRAGVPGSLIAIWSSLYDGCTTRVRTGDGYTAPIHIRSGVRQGCPLSPIVFDLVIDSVLRAVTDVGLGVELLGSRWSVMAYADDLVLVTESPADMRRLLAVAEDEASSVGLRFNPAKCATLHVGAGTVDRVLPTTFVVQGRTVRPMAEGEAYEHLGIPTGFGANQTPLAAMQALREDLRAVDRSLLAPWQKSEAVATFLLPRLDFLLRGASVEKRPLTALDLEIRRTVKGWLNLPQRASAEVVYLPPSRGGCGLLPLADLADVLVIAHVFRLLTADDRAVRDLAWASMRGVVGRRIGTPPTCDDVAAFLSGSLEGRLRGGGEQSLWSRARNAARRQSERFAVRWRWCGEREELVLECRGPRGRITKIPPGARAQVIGRLRAAVAEFYASTLITKPDQGKVFEVSSRHRVSNHYMRGGSFTRFADWRFVHRARLDVLPLNGARRWGEGDKRCRRCGEVNETLPHVLCHCGIHSAAVQWRHDAVLLRLRKACRLPGVVTVNQRVGGLDGELGTLRPDLVVRHEPSKSVVICDVTVPFENRWTAFEDARERKVAKYSPMAEALQQQGYRVVVTAFVVGALGSWDPRNEAVLKLLRVSRAYGAMMRRLMVSDTIRWSRDIYVEHVSGVRQYEAPPRPADGSFPNVPPPRAVRRRVTGARADGGVLVGDPTT